METTSKTSAARPKGLRTNPQEILEDLQDDIMSCESLRMMNAREVLLLCRMLHDELDRDSIENFKNMYAGWLQSDLADGMDGHSRSNMYHEFNTSLDFLNAVILITDHKSFVMELEGVSEE